MESLEVRRTSAESSHATSQSSRGGPPRSPRAIRGGHWPPPARRGSGPRPEYTFGRGATVNATGKTPTRPSIAIQETDAAQERDASGGRHLENLGRPTE